MNDIPFADYLRRFDYDERVAMKIQLPELLKLYAEGQVQLIDIRFNEEYAAWRLGIESRYLTDGMLGLADHLRGDRARDYMERITTDTNTD